MNHTPGPWEVREERVGDRIVRRVIHDHNRSGRSHKPIATIHEGFTCTEADARIIAAAPDLLRELIRQVNRCPGRMHDSRYPNWHDGCCTDARALILRVQGGQP